MLLEESSFMPTPLEIKSNKNQTALVIEPEALKNHFLPRNPQPAIEVRLTLCPT